MNKKKLDRIIKQLTANKRKFSMMLALMSVALLLWGRLMLKQVPRTAVADPEAQAQLRARAGGRAGSATRGRERVFVDLPTELARDVFLMDTGLYPTLLGEDGSGEGKSGPEAADDGLQDRKIMEAASSLELQSTVDGGRAGAVINGRLLVVGQEINGFVLREVKPRHVVLERNGFELQLKM